MHCIKLIKKWSGIPNHSWNPVKVERRPHKATPQAMAKKGQPSQSTLSLPMHAILHQMAAEADDHFGSEAKSEAKSMQGSIVLLRWKEGHPMQPTAVADPSGHGKDGPTLSMHSPNSHACHSAPDSHGSR